MDIQPGDWIRFYQAGKLVIGRVEYLYESVTHRLEACTDIGCVRVDEQLIKEVRK
jgi:hypothetical protein